MSDKHLNQPIEMYLRKITIEGLSRNTIANYRMDLFDYLQFLNDFYPELSEWKEADETVVLHYLSAIRDQELKESSIRRKMSALRNLYKYLVIEKYIIKNPMLMIASPKKKKYLPTVLSEEEFERILRVPDLTTDIGWRDLAFLEVMYASGLRISELCELKLSDVHLVNQTIHIVGKGNTERIVLLGEQASFILDQYYQRVRSKWLKNDTPYVFLNRRGQPITRQGLWKILKAIVKQAGITKNVTPHTIRHSFATHLISRGMELRFVQELLGHAHIVTTQIYTEISGQKKVEDYMIAHPHATKGEKE